MTIAAQLTELTSVTGRCRRDASTTRYRAPTSVLASVAVPDYINFFRLPTGGTTPS